MKGKEACPEVVMKAAHSQISSRTERGRGCHPFSGRSMWTVTAFTALKLMGGSASWELWDPQASYTELWNTEPYTQVSKGHEYSDQNCAMTFLWHAPQFQFKYTLVIRFQAKESH